MPGERGWPVIAHHSSHEIARSLSLFTRRSLSSINLRNGRSRFFDYRLVVRYRAVPSSSFTEELKY
jgi:hypothetical protein